MTTIDLQRWIVVDLNDGYASWERIKIYFLSCSRVCKTFETKKLVSSDGNVFEGGVNDESFDIYREQVGVDFLYDMFYLKVTTRAGKRK